IAALVVLGLTATFHSVPHERAAPAQAAAQFVTTRAVHDVSDSLSGLAPQPATKVMGLSEQERAESVAEGNETERAAAADPLVPDGGAAEQTAFGTRPAIAPAITFDNGLNGGSTSDNNIGAGPDSI